MVLRYNVAPTQPVATIRFVWSGHSCPLAYTGKNQRAGVPAPQAGASRVLAMMRWGMVPSWAKDISIGGGLINARSETLLDKPAFRDAFRARRCLIPADGFYEWKKAGKERQPYHFGMKDDALFAFAGLWDRWKSPTGQMLESCSILTTVPNELLQDVHDRMPVILPSRHYGTWLTAPSSEVPRLADLLLPFDANLMKRYAVSALVNKPQNEVPECAQEVSETAAAQAKFW